VWPGSKVELFARRQRRGFVAHGNAVLKIVSVAHLLRRRVQRLTLRERRTLFDLDACPTSELLA